MVHIIANGNNRALALPTVLFIVFLMNMSFLIAIQAWDVQIKRENEAELLWRGRKIKTAIERFYTERRMYPESLEQLHNLKYLRKPYTDPMTKEGHWDYIRPPHSMNQIMGVKSQSEEKSFYIYEDMQYYNQWEFVADTGEQQRPPRPPRPN